MDEKLIKRKIDREQAKLYLHYKHIAVPEKSFYAKHAELKTNNTKEK